MAAPRATPPRRQRHRPHDCGEDTHHQHPRARHGIGSTAVRGQPLHTEEQCEEDDQQGAFEDPAIPLRTARDKGGPDKKRKRARRVLNGEIAIRHAAASYGLAVSTVDGEVNRAYVDKADHDCKLS